MSSELLALMTEEDRWLLAYNNQAHIFVRVTTGPSRHYAFQYGGRWDHLPHNHEELDAKGEQYEVWTGPALMGIDYYGNVEGVGGAALVEAGTSFVVQAPNTATFDAVVKRVETVYLPDKEWYWMYTLEVQR